MSGTDHTRLERTKSAARRAAGATRDTIGAGSRQRAAQAIVKPGLELIARLEARSIAGFYPVRSEINTLLLLEALVEAGCEMSLPIIAQRGGTLVFRRWQTGDDLIEGAFGVPVPGQDAPPCRPDVLLVPLLAYDGRGWRLGYGGGYYDRTLKALRARRRVVAVGLGFAKQQVDDVPHGVEDVALDWMLTQSAVLKFDRPSAGKGSELDK